MAPPLTYADNSLVREGDFVLVEHGNTLGRVSEIIDNTALADEKKLEGLGVVVDAQPKGFVFLSEACLNDDPLQFVRRGPGEQTRFLGAIALGVGVLVLLPALYSLLSAIYSALSTGEVLVISVGRTEVRRELVPWRAGWARFAGPLILFASLFALFEDSRGVTFRWWLAAAGSATALAMLGFSSWFISGNRLLGFLAGNVFIVVALQIGKKLGRVAVYAFILACFGLLFWMTFR